MDLKCRLGVIFAEREIKQGEFAGRIGVSKAAMSAIKNGHSKPSFKVTYRICEELNMDMRDIWVKQVEEKDESTNDD